MAGLHFGRVQRHRVNDEIATRLRDAILDGRFIPGQKLPPERELAAEFGVNRTSIREALKTLESLRLVEVRQGSGATVCDPVEGSLDLLGPMLFHADQLDPDLLVDMLEVTTPMLAEMARLAVLRHTPEQLHALRTLRDVLADPKRPNEERFAAGREIVVLVADMSHNRVWRMLARRTRDLFRSTPFREARRRLRRDPTRLVPILDAALVALDAGEPESALRAVQALVADLGSAGFGRAEEPTPASVAAPQ